MSFSGQDHREWSRLESNQTLIKLMLQLQKEMLRNWMPGNLSGLNKKGKTSPLRSWAPVSVFFPCNSFFLILNACFYIEHGFHHLVSPVSLPGRSTSGRNWLTSTTNIAGMLTGESERVSKTEELTHSVKKKIKIIVSRIQNLPGLYFYSARQTSEGEM